MSIDPLSPLPGDVHVPRSTWDGLALHIEQQALTISGLQAALRKEREFYWQGYKAALEDAELAVRAGKDIPEWLETVKQKFNLRGPTP